VTPPTRLLPPSHARPGSLPSFPSRRSSDLGASARTNDTAWRCMLAPMRARLASSCSRNGIMAVATETIYFGETSMRSTSDGGTRSEEHTSELQSRGHLVCRLLLEKKKETTK